MKHFLAVLALLLPSMAFAAPKVSQERLDATARYWQHVLMLDDWRVSVAVVSDSVLPPGIAGLSQRDGGLRLIGIVVLDPADYAKRPGLPHADREIVRDIEDTILHELMHLRLSRVAQSGQAAPGESEEYLVVRMTTAMLKLHREMR